MRFIESLKLIKVNHLEERLYSLDEIKKTADEIIEVDSNHWLAFKNELSFHDEKPNDLQNCSLAFALFEVAQCEGDDINTLVNIVFCGDGPTGSLREPRHMWWGDEEGYTFYLPAKAVIKTLQILEKYFDFD